MNNSESSTKINSKLRRQFDYLEKYISAIENAYKTNPAWYSEDIPKVCNSLSINLKDTKGYIFSFDNPDHIYTNDSLTNIAKQNMAFVNSYHQKLIEGVGMHNHILIEKINEGINCINNYITTKTKKLESILA